MEQSQVKFSHCWMHTPMLAHESSWQVVLGPGKKAGKGRGRERYHRRKQKKKKRKNESSQARHVDNAKATCRENPQRKKRSKNSGTTGSPTPTGRS